MQTTLLDAASRHPDRPALWAKGAGRTYRELFEEAGSMATALAEGGVAPGERVAIFAQRNIVAYAGILASVLAGCTYVPLNARFPLVRNRAILTAAGAKAVIVDAACAGELAALLDGIAAEVLVIAPEATPPLPGIAANVVAGPALPTLPLAKIRPRAPAGAGQPAYILFTSGTTGAPKGVPISHANLGHYLGAIRDIAPVGFEDKLLQFADLTFDLSVHDIFVAWTNGAELVSVPENAAILAPRLIRERNVTGCMLVPSAATQAFDRRLLKPGSMPSLKYTWFLGEALPTSVARAWGEAAPNSRLYNTYGPTEATILLSSFEFDRTSDYPFAVMPIGHPIPGMRMATFGPDDRPLPPGETGEIFLAGPQLTPGYWQAPHLTAERFVTVGDTRWYRSGDSGRLDPSCGFIFGGRLDRQVKINGYRVELQEIEGAMRKACGREQVAVIAWPLVSAGNATGCVAFVAGAPMEEDPILRSADALLPPYMVPSRLTFLDHLPLNSNGKVDYNVLARMVADGDRRS